MWVILKILSGYKYYIKICIAIIKWTCLPWLDLRQFLLVCLAKSFLKYVAVVNTSRLNSWYHVDLIMMIRNIVIKSVCQMCYEHYFSRPPYSNNALHTKIPMHLVSNCCWDSNNNTVTQYQTSSYKYMCLAPFGCYFDLSVNKGGDRDGESVPVPVNNRRRDVTSSRWSLL